MRFSLSKENVGYHQVKSYHEVQNFLPLLIPTTIPKTSMNCLETCACSTYMPIRSPIKSFSLLGTALIRPSKSSQNCHQPHTHQNFHRKYEVVYLAMKACNFSSTHSEQLTMTTKIRYEGKAVNCFHETMCVWFTWVEKLSSTKWGYASDIFPIAFLPLISCRVTWPQQPKLRIQLSLSAHFVHLCYTTSQHIYTSKKVKHTYHIEQPEVCSWTIR